MQKATNYINNNTLNKIFSANKNILLAYLIGSFSRGEERKDSDIDIVLIMDSIKELNYGKISSQISDALHTDNVDVRIIIPKETDPLFLFQIVKDGKIIYQKTPNSRLQFETYALKVYYDTQHIRDIYNKYLDQRFEQKQFAK